MNKISGTFTHIKSLIPRFLLSFYCFGDIFDEIIIKPYEYGSILKQNYPHSIPTKGSPLLFSFWEELIKQEPPHFTWTDMC